MEVDVFDPALGQFCRKTVTYTGANQGQLTAIQASIDEATASKGPLNARKLLSDLAEVVALLTGDRRMNAEARVSAEAAAEKSRGEITGLKHNLSIQTKAAVAGFDDARAAANKNNRLLARLRTLGEARKATDARIVGLESDLAYSRERCNEADAEIERLRAALKDAKTRESDQTERLRIAKADISDWGKAVETLKVKAASDEHDHLLEAEKLRAEVESLRTQGVEARGVPEESELWLVIAGDDEYGEYSCGDGTWSDSSRDADVRGYIKEDAEEIAARDSSYQIISKVNAKKRDEDDRWVIRDADYDGRWWMAPGNGYTTDLGEAHQYTWRKARDTLGNECQLDRNYIVHISDAEAKVARDKS